MSRRTLDCKITVLKCLVFKYFLGGGGVDKMFCNYEGIQAIGSHCVRMILLKMHYIIHEQPLKQDLHLAFFSTEKSLSETIPEIKK